MTDDRLCLVSKEKEKKRVFYYIKLLFIILFIYLKNRVIRILYQKELRASLLALGEEVADDALVPIV